MKNLTLDQAQLILVMFQMQNAERDIEEFIPDFHSYKNGFSNYKKIGDLILDNASLRAKEDSGGGFAWHIIYLYNGVFSFSPFNGDIYTRKPFDIMKHISFEDKV